MTSTVESPGARAYPAATDFGRAEQIARRVARTRLGVQAWEGVDVEDVVQDVLLRFSELDLDEVENWEAWVVTTTKNRCADLMAATRRHRNTPIDDGSLPEDAEIRIATRVVGASAAGMIRLLEVQITRVLSERERAVLLAHIDGWRNAEIAQRFGYASAESVAVTVSRAKKRVRDQFATDAQRRAVINPQRVY